LGVLRLARDRGAWLGEQSHAPRRRQAGGGNRIAALDRIGLAPA